MTTPPPGPRPLLRLAGADAATVEPAPCADACCVTDGDAAVASAGRGETRRRVLLLSWISLIWMSAEGVLGLGAGITAGSIALTGWALGSIIEGTASVIVIWRFTGTRTHSDTAEHRAQLAVAISFFLLGPYITAEAVRDLLTSQRPATSALGIIVTAISLLGMPALGVAKRRYGNDLHSAATSGEGTQNLICAAQAGAVLIGLALNAIVHAAWIDPAIALLLAGWAVREGVLALRGQDCC